jgi:hypothetical protein
MLKRARGSGPSDDERAPQTRRLPVPGVDDGVDPLKEEKRSHDASAGSSSTREAGHSSRGSRHTKLERLEKLTLSDFECGVCFSLLCDPVTIACGHTFCRACIITVVERLQKKCPTCRSPCLRGTRCAAAAPARPLKTSAQ